MITIEEMLDKADCFIWGHDWVARSYGYLCRNCRERRR